MASCPYQLCFLKDSTLFLKCRQWLLLFYPMVQFFFSHVMFEVWLILGNQLIWWDVAFVHCNGQICCLSTSDKFYSNKASLVSKSSFWLAANTSGSLFGNLKWTLVSYLTSLLTQCTEYFLFPHNLLLITCSQTWDFPGVFFCPLPGHWNLQRILQPYSAMKDWKW